MKANKLVYSLTLFFFSLGAMESFDLPFPSALIERKGDAEQRKAIGFIPFEQARICAYKDHLLREIPKLAEGQNFIYSRDAAADIVQQSYDRFGGANGNAIPGYLEILEHMEARLQEGNNVHALTPRLCELERAVTLANSNHTVLEFGAMVKVPDGVRRAINQIPGVYLLMDIDILAQTPQGTPMIEEVKSYQFCSDQAQKELSALIHGMEVLNKSGIPSRMYTKFRLPRAVREVAQQCKVDLICSDAGKMKTPTAKPVYQASKIPHLIDPARIRIDVPGKCLVCYDEISESRKALVRDLETCYIAYIKSGMAQDEDMRKHLGTLFKASRRFGQTPGLLSSILIPIAARMEEKKWGKVRSTLFELRGALDTPTDKEVVAIGADLFFDASNQNIPHDAPTYKKTPDGYLIQKKANTGFDIDVLLRDKENPDKSAIIEATTGASSVKGFEKFQSMGNALNAEVYVLHDFDANGQFDRTAYVKQPVKVQHTGSGINHALPWQIARRTNTCVQAVTRNKNIYRPIVIEMSDCEYGKLLYEFNTLYNKLRENNQSASLWSPVDVTKKNTGYVFDDLNENISAVFALLDGVTRKADAEVYRRKIQHGLLGLLEKEKRTGRVGSVAFAVLFLTHLNCTISDAGLQERFLPTTMQYSFDVNAVLRKALDGAIEEECMPD